MMTATDAVSLDSVGHLSSIRIRLSSTMDVIMIYTNSTPRNLFVLGIVVVSVFATVAVPGTVAAQDAGTNGTTTAIGTGTASGTMKANNTTATASLTTNTTTAGALANHTVTITLGDAVADNLTGVTVNYTGTNASTDPTIENVPVVTLGDQRIPYPSNVTVAGTNFVQADFSFELNRSLQPEPGDQLTLIYPVQNPLEPGNYTVEVVVNPETDAVSLTTNLTVTPNETTPAAGTNGTASVAGNGTTTGGGTAGGTTTSSGSGPGFTVLAGIVGVLAIALLATRRN
jgi:PGF-CTERM protein